MLNLKIIWCMVPEMWSATEFLVVSGHFLPFYSTNSAKNQNFEKMKKKQLKILSFYTNDGSGDMKRQRQNVLSFQTISCPFSLPSSPLTIWKINILKKWKKHLDISSFYTSVHKYIEDMENDGHNFGVFLEYFLPFYPTSNLKNQNFWKNERLKISSFYTRVPKITIICYTNMRYGVWRM